MGININNILIEDRTIKMYNKGFVEVVDCMGDYKSVAKAARVSYKSSGSNSDDKNLIYTLLKNHHDSPFEHAVITYHMKAPIFVARHFVRHRISSWNELSGRYSKLSREFYVPKGSTDEMIKNMENAFDIYESLLRGGMKKQEARIVLPVGTFTEWFWTLNVRSLMNVMDLRMSEAAQEETREYATAMYNLWKLAMPILSSAYMYKRKK